MEHHHYEIPRGDMLLDVFSNTLLQNMILLGDALFIVTALLIIRIGFKDKVPGIPALALCFCLGWDFYFTVVDQPTLDGAFNRRHFIIQIIWLGLDLIMLWQVWIYGRGLVKLPELKRHYTKLLLFVLTLAIVGQAAYIHSTQDAHGEVSGLISTLVLSIMFVYMYINRPHLEGVSVGAAWSKFTSTLLIGTGFVLLAVKGNTVSASFLPLFLFGCLFFSDALLIYLIYTHGSRKETLIKLRGAAPGL